MKKVFLISSLVIMTMILTSCTNSKKQADATAVNTDSMKVTNDEWITMFDGETFNGWRGYDRTDMPSAWTIEDGAIKINGSGRGEAGAKQGGDIIFDQKFKNFELTFEWKVSKGANSGVFYLAQEIKGEPIWKSSPEFQILDNDNHPDAKLGKDNNRKSASLYDLIPAVPQNSKPFGEWNTGAILVSKGTVIHKQNGVNVVEYHLWTADWEKLIEGSKFKGWENFINAGGDNQEGFIGLQDHGDDVWFKNIKIRVIN
ncbi:MAG: 3-keto-disaccharide hydrolase [Candidatus Saccharimonadaceae bacterium]